MRPQARCADRAEWHAPLRAVVGCPGAPLDIGGTLDLLAIFDDYLFGHALPAGQLRLRRDVDPEEVAAVVEFGMEQVRSARYPHFEESSRDPPPASITDEGRFEERFERACKRCSTAPGHAPGARRLPADRTSGATPRAVTHRLTICTFKCRHTRSELGEGNRHAPCDRHRRKSRNRSGRGTSLRVCGGGSRPCRTQRTRDRLPRAANRRSWPASAGCDHRLVDNTRRGRPAP